jgi:ABC-type dipeptide/oligopeptide/nickel transport system permease subunit
VVIACMLLACLATLPWTMASVTLGGGAPQRRYEATNLRMNLMPPRWWPMSDRDLARFEKARAAGAVEPSRWLGTDRLGRDVLARCLAGGALSILIGISAALLSVIIGVAWGMMAAFAGGPMDSLMMRTVDILYGLPSILLVVLLAVAVDGAIERVDADPGPVMRGAVNLGTLLVAIGAVSWLTMARVIRGQVLSIREQPYMEACRAIGVPPRRQILRHVLPNLVGPIVVYATLAVPAAILSESFLSFLGIGIREPLPSWGNLASDGLAELNPVASRWWLLLWPCLLIAITLLSLNFLGEGLKERFDPRAAEGARRKG